MNPGPPMYGQFPPPKRGMGCWAWGAIVAVAVVVVCGGGLALIGGLAMNSPEFRKGFDEGIGKPNSVLPPLKADAPLVTATALVAAFDANGIAAERRYRQGPIRVKGTITTIDRLGGSSYVVLSGGGSTLTGVQATFTNEAELLALKKGQTVTVYGQCTGQTPPLNVMMENCRISP